MAHPLPEAPLLVVCGAIADCDDYEHIAAWGAAYLPFLRTILPNQNLRKLAKLIPTPQPIAAS